LRKFIPVTVVRDEALGWRGAPTRPRLFASRNLFRVMVIRSGGIHADLKIPDALAAQRFDIVHP
jgi:hypothetical protein